MVAARLAVVLAGLTIALPAAANELRPEQARRFVVGKTFAFTCFDGTHGAGRVQADGSVVGTIQAPNGVARRAALPAGSVYQRGEQFCATVKGMSFQPCFSLQQTSLHSFRGSVAGLGFAYCDFTRGGRPGPALRTAAPERGPPTVLRASIAD
jgi:hypothetical protein